MGQFFRVNGDYNIVASAGDITVSTKPSGIITLDTNPVSSVNRGEVRITGDLVVDGFTTTISSENLEIEDNIIVINKGETGPGVSLGYSGIEVDRGQTPDSSAVDRAAFVWFEGSNSELNEPDIPTNDLANSGSWIIGLGISGSYSFDDSNLRLRRLLTDSSTDNGDLTLIGVSGSSVVKVRADDSDDGTEYRDNVTGPNDVPNKKYVDDAILNNPTFQIRSPDTGTNSIDVDRLGEPSDDTRIIIADIDVKPNNTSTEGSIEFWKVAVGKTPEDDESRISFIVNGTLIGEVFENRLEIGRLELNGNEITLKGGTLSTDEDIYIRTNGTGKLKTDYALMLETPGVHVAVDPGYVSDSDNHIIYSADKSAGDSGLYFVTNVNNEVSRDELVSKKRALLFSMIF